jgi:hypothetical protein
MRVVILVPRQSDGGRRDAIWQWVRHNWLEKYHPDWPIYEGTDDSEVFSMAAARNNAAELADRFQKPWDVAIIVDADTIAHPAAVEMAAERAYTSSKMWIAGDMRMRMDQKSSDRIMSGGLWFPRPEGIRHPKGNVIDEMCYGEPSSGVFAIGRPLWDATGGYFESLRGWGWEDLTFITQCCIVGKGIDWIRDSMLLHFYHERTPLTTDTDRNHGIWKRLHELSCANKGAAMDYLRELGHHW